jgi:hypothetical protein
MLKSAIALSFVFATLAFVPARADDAMKCDEAGMSKMQTGVMGMTDATKKEMAMKEMSMAKESMAKKDDKDCVMHMDKVHGMM